MSSFNVDASVSKYYIHSSYIPTYYYVYIFIEQWLAANIFRNDLSRVFMASNDYAFRRRFELTDMSENYEDIDASSLRFPFGNYWAQNTGWKVDDRPAANTAAQVYEGLYLGTTKVRAVNVTLPVGIQLYFDREDDARLAYDRLFFYSFNRHFYSTEANIAGNRVGLPMNLQLDDLTFNPSFKESDWLKQNRIFVLTFTMNVSTYILNPPKQPDYTHDDTDLSDYDDGNEQYYIVNDVILNFWNKSSNIKVETYCGTDLFPPKGKSDVFYVDSLTPEDKKGYDTDPVTRRPKIYKWNPNFTMDETGKSIGGYEEVNTQTLIDIDIASIGVDGSIARGSVDVTLLRVANTEVNSATIEWDYSEEYDTSNVDRITISIDDMKTWTEVPVDAKSFTLENLEEGKHYIAYVSFYDKDGSVKKLYLEFATLVSSSSLANRVLPNNSLVGLKWDL